ncbi:MAG: hypothetical protein F6J95_025380 [Leptolyngbya sp. SIO1E4]|nr:hypothetical protein [Leptolyngbya sp. SIO1E4]
MNQQYSSSSSSSQSIAYVNSSGAGGHSRASATSSTGKTQTTQEEVFVSGAHSVSAQASTHISHQVIETSADVSIPAQGDDNGASENVTADESDSNSDEDPLSLADLLGSHSVTVTHSEEIPPNFVLIVNKNDPLALIVEHPGVDSIELPIEVTAVTLNAFGENVSDFLISTLEDAFGEDVSDFLIGTLEDAFGEDVSDFLIGTLEDATLVSIDDPDLLVMYHSADLSSLPENYERTLEAVDAVIELFFGQGDRQQTLETFNLSDITLNVVEINASRSFDNVLIDPSRQADFAGLL